MRKIVSVLLVLIFAVSPVCLFPVEAGAADITPYYNNTNTAGMGFTISDSGVATVGLSFVGYEGITSSGRIYTRIERLVGGTWVTVDIGVANNRWVDAFGTSYFATSHSVNLSVRGEYRAVTDFFIYGTGGNPDSIKIINYDTY